MCFQKKFWIRYNKFRNIEKKIKRNVTCRSLLEWSWTLTTRKETANLMSSVLRHTEDCTAKRGSNRRTGQRIDSWKLRRNSQRTTEGQSSETNESYSLQRNEQCQDYHNGHYSRSLTTATGDVTLKASSSRVSPLRSPPGEQNGGKLALRCYWQEYPSDDRGHYRSSVGAAKSLEYLLLVRIFSHSHFQLR